MTYQSESTWSQPGGVREIQGPIVNIGGRMVFLGSLKVIMGAPPMRSLPVVPSPQIELIGREKLRQQLQTKLDAHPTLAVTGPAGVGKTALVLAHAAQLQTAGHYGAVFWVTCNPNITPLEAIRALEIQALPDSPLLAGGDRVAEAGRVRSRLTDFISTDCRGACLVVIDMVDIVDDTSLQVVRGLLAAAPKQARHIVIARQVPPALRNVGHLKVPPLEVDAAIRLLTRQLSRSNDLSERQLNRIVDVAGRMPQQIVEQAHRLNEFSEHLVHPADDIAAYIRALG